jgi:hypothetical protein
MIYIFRRQQEVKEATQVKGVILVKAKLCAQNIDSEHEI